MFILVLSFILILCIALFLYLKSDNRKDGLIISMLSSMICLLSCIPLLKINNVRYITIAFCIYYIARSWAYMGAYTLAYHLGYGHKCKMFKNPVLYISIIQTLIIFKHIIDKPIFTVRRHIAFGYNWWMSYAREQKSGIDFFAVYRVLVLVAAVCIVIALLYSIKGTPRIYRDRIYTLTVCQVIYTCVNMIMVLREQPVFLTTFMMVPFVAAAVYYAQYYSDRKLRNFSLMAFADDLSEGFVLYNDNDNLIYINGYMKRIIDEDILKQFTSIEVMKSWASDLTVLNGVQAKKVVHNGEEYFFDIEEIALSDSGIRTGTMYDLKDITNSAHEILVMEQINDELERTAAMKADFLANMSHELRTPMNAVIGMAEIVLREQLSPQAEEYVRQIKSSGTSLLNIINDILDFSKIESGKMDIIPDEYEPAVLCQEIVNTLQVRAENKEVELFCRVNTGLPEKLYGDSSRIRQVLINIANNAIKFTNQGQVLILVDFEKTDDENILLKVHCQDSGIGIKPEDLEKLFTSFTQVDSKRNRNVEGTGLGLAISKSLIQAMGGEIGVASEYGKGSDFYFTLPQKIVDVNAADKAAIESKKVLYVTQSDEIYAFLNTEFENLNMESCGIKKYSSDMPECDFMIVDEVLYDSAMEEYVTGRPELVCGILTRMSSNLASSLPNVRIIKKPLSTMGLLRFFRGQEQYSVSDEKKDEFFFDFTAPQASVLIVDDNQVNLSVAAGLLEPLAMKIDTALSGADAIRMVNENRYDIIFMDHMMPEMDGVETTQKLRAEVENAKDTPIIALSANALAEARNLFLSNGMNDFVAKPIEVKAIVSKVKEWLPADMIISQEPVEMVSSQEEEIYIEGIDTRAALELMGSVALYKKIIKDYFDNIDKIYNEIVGCYEAMDIENYTIKVHALKSSSRQVGAMELAGMAEKLENAGHTNDVDYIRNNNDEALLEYRHVQELIRPALKLLGIEEQPIEQQAFDRAGFIELLDRLTAACEDLDMDIMEEVSDGLKKMETDGEISELKNQLCEAIEMIDVDTCEELIQKLKQLSVS